MKDAGFCFKCGKPIMADAKFCANCGAVLTPVGQREKKKITVYGYREFNLISPTITIKRNGAVVGTVGANGSCVIDDITDDTTLHFSSGIMGQCLECSYFVSYADPTDCLLTFSQAREILSVRGTKDIAASQQEVDRRDSQHWMAVLFAVIGAALIIAYMVSHF